MFDYDKLTTEADADHPKKSGSSDSRFPTLAQLEAELEWETEVGENRRDIRKNVAFLAVFIAALLFIELYAFPMARVSGTSMEPTLYEGELLIGIADKTPEVGDVITFKHEGYVLVKRVIALSGDSVNILEDGTVLVNGQLVEEPYVVEKALGKCDITLPIVVPEGQIFVMGDHRAVSVDSRSTVVGTVSIKSITSRVLLRLMPFRKFGLIR